MLPEPFHNTLRTIHQLFIEQITENNKHNVLTLLHSITETEEERARVVESVREMLKTLESDTSN